MEVLDGWDHDPRPDEAQRANAFRDRARLERPTQHHRSNVVMPLRGDLDGDTQTEVRLARHESHLLVAKAANVFYGYAADCSTRGWRSEAEWGEGRRRGRECGQKGRLRAEHAAA